MPELTATEHLDIVLKFLYNDRGHSDLISILERLEKEKNFLLKIDGDDGVRILNKLIKDGYVEFQEVRLSYENPMTNEPIIVRRYWISFEGKIFVETGGYKEAIRKEAAQIKANETDVLVKLRNDKRLVIGTWVVAIGAIALVLWEMIKTFLIECH